ncbi:oligosaccharide flippase family protein [Paeniglutamicibacter sp. MACA_103]|uniref:oligosaccharide flippase family protein n=1 Tax=Paeniglutamicibacter sp. MACA_103 TaxID=3377337 RepID=UPI003895A1D4
MGSAVRKGAIWSAGGTIMLRLSNVVVMALVARILSPEDFGVFALAITVHAFLISLAELGVAASIARADLDLEKIAPTVSTIAIVSSLALAAPMFLLAAPLALLLGSAEAADAIRILSIGVAFIGPFAVPGAILQREFRQHMVFVATIAGFLPGSTFLVWSALTGGGVEALAWSRVLAQAISGLVMILCLRKFYRPGLRWTIVGPLLGFGLPLAMSNLLSQVLLNIDNVFVARLLGVEELGAYSIAFAVSVWSTAVLGTMLNSVVLPGITSVVRDGGALDEAVASAVRIVAWVAAPICTLTFAFASPLIRMVYGRQWDASGPVLRSLAVYGFVFVLGLLFANVIIATGRTSALFWVQFFALLALLPALPLGISIGGLVGAGWAHVAVVACVTLPAYLYSLRKTTGIRLASILTETLPPLAAAVVAATIAYFATMTFSSATTQTLFGGSLGTILYLGMTWRTGRRILFPGLNRTAITQAPLGRSRS